MKMNYVSMQIHRFSRESLAMVVLGDFSTLCTHFLAARCASLYFDGGGCAKESLRTEISLWSAEFSIFQSWNETIELGFRGNEKQSGRKFCVNSIPFFALLFFRYEQPSFFGSGVGR